MKITGWYNPANKAAAGKPGQAFAEELTITLAKPLVAAKKPAGRWPSRRNSKASRQSKEEPTTIQDPFGVGKKAVSNLAGFCLPRKVAPSIDFSRCQRKIAGPPRKHRFSRRRHQDRYVKLIVFNQVTLDGYFAGPGGDISWAHKANSDAEWNAFVAENALRRHARLRPRSPMS